MPQTSRMFFKIQWNFVQVPRRTNTEFPFSGKTGENSGKNNPRGTKARGEGEMEPSNLSAFHCMGQFTPSCHR